MKMQEHLPFPTEIITVEEAYVKLFEDKKVVEELLERLDPFIVAEVGKRAYGLSEQKQDEISQNVRIKLWHALEKRIIVYPRAYVRTIIKNTFNDLGRECLLPELVSLDEYGEVSRGSVVVNLSEEWENPEQVVEQREAMANWLEIASEALLLLPPRQQVAIVCSLFQHIDDVVKLKQVFERYEVPIEMEDWPNDVEEKQRLKALVSVARRKVAQFIENNFADFKVDVINTSFFVAEHVEKLRTKQEVNVL